MQALYKNCTSETIKAPKPLVTNQARRVIGMESLHGSTLRRTMLKLNPIGSNSINQILDLSAVALARFHATCLDSSSETSSFESPFLMNNTDTKPAERAFESCNLGSKVRPFLDFAPANIFILEEKEPTISLLDFPFRNCVSTPHLDLAGFRFALRVMRQHPQFRFIRLGWWWDPDGIFERLLRKYASEFTKTPQ